MVRRISETVLWEANLAGAEDAHGNPIEGFAAGVVVGIFAFDPGSGASLVGEPRVAGRDLVVSEPTTYMPSTVVFSPHDRITARGILYEVVGVTREWRHPNGRRKGNVASLRVVEG